MDLYYDENENKKNRRQAKEKRYDTRNEEKKTQIENREHEII